MKKLFSTVALLIAGLISLSSSAQQNVLLQELPRLSDSEFNTIENNQSERMIREAATRVPGQYNVIILSGDNNTKKQNTARWLAQKINVVIYRVDLSLVVTEDFRETERNISLVFEATKNQSCILFFDEGDALFGERTPVKEGHDRYDNQGSDYFSREVEKYRSSIIISVTASNNINPLIFEKYVRFSIH